MTDDLAIAVIALGCAAYVLSCWLAGRTRPRPAQAAGRPAEAARPRPLVRGFRLRMTMPNHRPAISRAMGYVQAAAACASLREMLAEIELVRGTAPRVEIVADTLYFRRAFAASALLLAEGGRDELVAAQFSGGILLCELWPADRAATAQEAE